MVIGAGRSGQMLIKELKTSDKTTMRVCCIIDDNPNKKGRYTEGVQIVGDRTCILEAAKKYEINKIIFQFRLPLQKISEIFLISARKQTVNLSACRAFIKLQTAKGCSVK